MPKIKLKAASMRVAVDARCTSQLDWLRKVSVLTIGGKRAPSHSQLVRRAVGLLTEHITMTLKAGHHDGLPGPRTEDIAAERAALDDYGRITEASSAARMVDPEGRLLPWQLAILANFTGGTDRGLAIPTKGKSDE